MNHLNKKWVFIAVAILLFVAVTLALNLITHSIQSAAAPLLDVPAETQTEEAVPSPVSQKTDTESQTQAPEKEEEPETEQTVMEAAEAPAQPESEQTKQADRNQSARDIFSLLAADPAVDMESSEESLETVVGGVTLECEDYGYDYSVSEIAKGEEGSRCQCVNYVKGRTVYTDIVVQANHDTFHFSVNRSMDKSGFDTLSLCLSEHYALHIPEATELRVSEESEAAESIEHIHDQPVIVR